MCTLLDDNKFNEFCNQTENGGSISFDNIPQNDQFNILNFITDKTGLDENFIRGIANFTYKDNVSHGKFELLFSLFIKEASPAGKSDILIEKDGVEKKLEIKGKNGKIASINGYGKLGSTSDFARELKEEVNGLIENLSTDIGTNNIQLSNDITLASTSSQEYNYIPINSLINRILDGTEIDKNDGIIHNKLKNFLIEVLKYIFGEFVGKNEIANHQNIIEKYIDDDLQVDIKGLCQELGIIILKNYKDKDNFKYLMVCSPTSYAVILLDLDKVEDAVIKSNIKFEPPGITSKAAQAAAFGVTLKKFKFK